MCETTCGHDATEHVISTGLLRSKENNRQPSLNVCICSLLRALRHIAAQISDPDTVRGRGSERSPDQHRRRGPEAAAVQCMREEVEEVCHRDTQLETTSASSGRLQLKDV